MKERKTAVGERRGLRQFTEDIVRLQGSVSKPGLALRCSDFLVTAVAIGRPVRSSEVGRNCAAIETYMYIQITYVFGSRRREREKAKRVYSR